MQYNCFYLKLWFEHYNYQFVSFLFHKCSWWYLYHQLHLISCRCESSKYYHGHINILRSYSWKISDSKIRKSCSVNHPCKHVSQCAPDQDKLYFLHPPHIPMNNSNWRCKVRERWWVGKHQDRNGQNITNVEIFESW